MKHELGSPTKPPVGEPLCPKCGQPTSNYQLSSPPNADLCATCVLKSMGVHQTEQVRFLPSEKDTNPKDAIGGDKLPLHLWPASATMYGCLGMLNGAGKYGRANFREYGIRTSIYISAAKRHLDAYFEGEEVDPDDGVPHLGAALACIAIIVDAKMCGKLTDDRNYHGHGYRDLVNELTPHVKRIREQHAGKDPKHFTIADE